MIHSIVPDELIFPEESTDISYVFENGILVEKQNGQIRRIISTNPSDYMTAPENL